MTKFIKKRYLSLIGIGLMYLWLVAAMSFIDWTKSPDPITALVGFAASVLASASAIAVFFYVNFLEQRVHYLTKQNSENEKSASFWQDQSQRAINELEKLRSKSPAA